MIPKHARNQYDCTDTFTVETEDVRVVIMKKHGREYSLISNPHALNCAIQALKTNLESELIASAKDGLAYVKQYIGGNQ